MNNQLEYLKVKLEKEIEEARQGAYYAKSGTENYYYQTREEALNWCYAEVLKILNQESIS